LSVGFEILTTISVLVYGIPLIILATGIYITVRWAVKRHQQTTVAGLSSIHKTNRLPILAALFLFIPIIIFILRL